MTKTEYIEVLNEKGERKTILKKITSQEITGIHGKYILDFLPKYFTENGNKVNETGGVFIVEILKLSNQASERKD